MLLHVSAAPASHGCLEHWRSCGDESWPLSEEGPIKCQCLPCHRTYYHMIIYYEITPGHARLLLWSPVTVFKRPTCPNPSCLESIFVSACSLPDGPYETCYVVYTLINGSETKCNSGKSDCILHFKSTLWSTTHCLYKYCSTVSMWSNMYSE